MLATRVASKGKEAEMLYSSYITSGSLYNFSDSLTQCAEYVHRGVRYDGNFLVDNFDRLTIK
jgi:hypothetical protein